MKQEHTVRHKMKPFKEIKQLEDKTKKNLRIVAPVEVPKKLQAFKLMDVFIKMCKEKGWHCNGGGVQFPNE